MSDAQQFPDPDVDDRADSAPVASARPDSSERGAEEQPDLGGHDDFGVSGEPEWPSGSPESVGAGTGTSALVGCTLAGRDQLPAARVLRDSFLRHHPTARFVLLLVDRPDLADLSEPDSVTVADLGLSAAEFARLATAYTAEELRAVLRPRLLRHLLGRGAVVLCFEPNVRVFQQLDDLFGSLAPYQPLAVFPRVLHPLVADGFRPSPGDLTERGMFDPNMFAVQPGAEELLDRWAQRARTDPAGGSGLLNEATALTEHQVIREPGVGLSVWNAVQRELSTDTSGQYTVDGSVLRSVHFEDFQPQRPWLLSATYSDRPRVLLSENPLLTELCANYRNALVGAGYAGEQGEPYDALPDVGTLPTALRRTYLAEWLADGQAPPTPFAPETGSPTTDANPADSRAEFLRWACQAADEQQRRAGGSRWTAAVWHDDMQLRRTYPDPSGVDAVAFHEWCLGTGVTSGRVPQAAVQPPAERNTALVDQLGISVVGRGTLAEVVRDAARVSGLPTSDSPCYPVVLRCTPEAHVPSGRYLVDVAPVATAPAEDAAETWYLSETSRAGVRRSDGPTRVVPIPAPNRESVSLPTRKGERARYGLSDEFVVASAVDLGNEHADNALGLVNAFLSAFPESGEVRLLLRVTSALVNPEAAERLRLATAADPRVLLDEAVDTDGADEGAAVVTAADCVLSLPRAEGDRHGLWLLTVIARGVPVIVAEHGAIAELLGAETARMVSCSDSGEPELDHAAQLLRTAARDPIELAEFGASARQQLQAKRTVPAAGSRLRERVEHAYRHWRTKWAEQRRGALDDPLRPLLVARHALHRTPDVALGSRNAMTPALRKAVLKAVSHYDEHLRDVLRSLVDGVEQTAAELLRRQDGVHSETDSEALRAEVSSLGQRQDQLAAQLLNADDAVVRARTDLADQQQRLRGVEQGTRADEQVNSLAERLDGLTAAVERVLDRVDALEQRQAQEQGQHSMVWAASWDAANALRRTEVLQRVLVREHERAADEAADSSTAVLCDAGLLRLPTEDDSMLPWLSAHSSWDTDVSALLDSLLEPGTVFVDIGAYVGYQTVRGLNAVGSAGAVLATEPCPRSARLLRRNVDVNVLGEVGSRLVLVEGAAWDSAAELVGQPGEAGGVDLREQAVDVAEVDVSIPATRLDQEWEQHEMLRGLRVSLVHVDVADQVHRVLAGMDTLLRRDRPSVVCAFAPYAVARAGVDPATTLEQFESWGYEIVPVGRESAVAPSDLVAAMEASGAQLVKLWLRPA